MKEIIRAAALMAAIICLIPAAAAENKEEGALNTSAPTVLSAKSDMLSVFSEKTGEITELSIEEYTLYAILAELPRIPDTEALKAQAVAARTYAARRILSGGDESIGGAHISDDPEKYQICLTDEQARSLYGADFDSAFSSAQAAAALTEGEILTYNGLPIVAAFHTASTGMTEASENVWGIPEPYLIPVLSEWDKTSPYYGAEYEFTSAEIFARISSEYENAKKDMDISTDVTPTGTVKTVTICGVALTGERLAQMLSLPSAAFTVSADESAACFTVNGSGHLAGMSMYGADCMAKEGYDYREILAHYYPGTEISLFMPSSADNGE